jgi:hypothetical protein
MNVGHTFALREVISLSSQSNFGSTPQKMMRVQNEEGRSADSRALRISTYRLFRTFVRPPASRCSAAKEFTYASPIICAPSRHCMHLGATSLQRDLKSAGAYPPWGFKSPSGHQHRLRLRFRRRSMREAFADCAGWLPDDLRRVGRCGLRSGCGSGPHPPRPHYSSPSAGFGASSSFCSRDSVWDFASA